MVGASPPEGTFVSIGAGYEHTCAVAKNTGAAACWGSNGNGRATPPAGTFTSISVGHSHTCGLRATGAVVCWGLDNYGQATPPAGAFVSVNAGTWHTCGVRAADGTAACWGRWAYGVDAGDW